MNVVILNTPLTMPYLRKVFSFYARWYDLQEYEKVFPGCGDKVWEIIQLAQK